VNVILVQVSPATVFCLLVFAHALADYPLQGDFLARGKNRNAPIPGVPWWICLSAHAVIHAGLVGLCTGSLALGVAEFCLHWIIDLAKCDGAFSAGERAFVEDQLLHIMCKALWVVALVGLPFIR
jgi:hypothetical protein